MEILSAVIELDGRTNKHDEAKKPIFFATFHCERTKTENRIVLMKDEHK
jgi:hypothetical protein